MYSVDIYSCVRRACLKDGMSARAAALYFNKDRKTIAKMLRHELPPEYRRYRSGCGRALTLCGDGLDATGGCACLYDPGLEGREELNAA